MNLYQEYSAETLQTLQQIEQMMFEDFKKLCSKHEIPYFGEWGTAIGAIRHKGMIPWDDDIDVCMLRPDYERFLSVAEKEYGDKYYILNARKDPRYPLMATRWCLANTVFKEKCMAHLDLPWGIFLDIYCFDSVPDDDALRKKQCFRAWLWGKMMTLRQVPVPVLFFYGWKAWVLSCGCFVCSKILSLFFSPRYLFKKAEAWARKYEGKPNCPYVGYFFGWTPRLSLYKLVDLFPTKTYPFEGGTIELPKTIDASLRRYYGDYMKLPDPERRHNHPPSQLDFGPYAAKVHE